MSRPTDAADKVPHVVYRLFNKHDQLIYVGMTKDLSTRLAHHRSPYINPWAHHVDHWTSETYPSRVDARAAEKALIAAELPPLNKNHGKGKDTTARDLYMQQYAALEPAPDDSMRTFLDDMFGHPTQEPA